MFKPLCFIRTLLLKEQGTSADAVVVSWVSRPPFVTAGFCCEQMDRNTLKKKGTYILDFISLCCVLCFPAASTDADTSFTKCLLFFQTLQKWYWIVWTGQFSTVCLFTLALCLCLGMHFQYYHPFFRSFSKDNSFHWPWKIPLSLRSIQNLCGPKQIRQSLLSLKLNVDWCFFPLMCNKPFTFYLVL